MTSNYSTNNTHLGKHDVFLSFRGKDTRDNFVSFLHRDLMAKIGIETYIDYKLGGGEQIEPALLQEIQESLISIVIFSENYADSIFCLRELSKILECKKTKHQIVIPVFYQVDPTDVQELRGSFANGLTKHEGKCNSEEMDSWRHALTEIANLKGWDSKVNRPDTFLVDCIVDDVQTKLRHMPLWCDHSSDSKSLIGIDSHIKKVESLLCIGSSEVIVLGLLGKSGVGKTTIARVVYNKISSQFDGSCFFNNVREESQKKGVRDVRDKISGELLGLQEKGFEKLEDSDIKRMLQRKKVLIVLDDVSSVQQLDELLKESDLFGQGSRIIVTSMDKQLHETHCHKTYTITELGYGEALQLFELHAFKGNKCPEEFKELSEMGVKYTEGNPLSLRILGSRLYKKGIQEWKSVLAKLERSLIPEMQKILMTSYDGLDWRQQRIFLDIACFFGRCHKYFVQFPLDCCGFDAKIGIDRLIDMNLLNISENNEIWMHDSLRQLGQDVVLQENFDDPRKRSRLWTGEDIDHVLTHHKGTETLQAMSLNMAEIDEIPLSSSVFEGMRNLRLLEIYFPPTLSCPFGKSNLLFPQGLTFLPKKLRTLRWDHYPLTSLPSNFCPKYLVQLSMSQGKIVQLWDNILQPFVNLKILQLSWMKDLNTINPVLPYLPNLELLRLRYCVTIQNIELCNVPNLKVMDLTGCKAVTHITAVEVPKLKNVNLTECVSLTTLYLSTPQNLEVLNLKLCLSLDQFPDSIAKSTKLTTLNLQFCKRLKYLPELPTSLQCLDASGCRCIRLPDRCLFKKVETRGSEVACSELFNFCGCYGLEQSSCTQIMDDALPRIQRMATSLFKQIRIQKELDVIGSSKPIGFRCCVPGKEVPHWFSYKNEGSSLKRIRPTAAHCYSSSCGSSEEFLGFVFGVVIQGLVSPKIVCQCTLITKDGLVPDLRFPYCEGINRNGIVGFEHVFVWYNWNSSINYSDHFFEEASFNFYAKDSDLSMDNNDVEVLNCGVHLLFAQDCESTVVSSSSS